MAVSAPAVRRILEELVGAQHVVSDAGALAALAVDGATPGWAVRPGSVEEVSRLLALASREGWSVVPRGSGSALDLGWPPSRLDLLLDCRRLDAVIEHSPEDMVATVGAGLSLAALGAALARHRQRFPVDPPGGASRSLGGVLATGASGPLRFRYSQARDLLLGVRFVQADGAVTWGGSKVVKSVTGYDVPKLLAGSLGTLGVIVEAAIRLHPAPASSGSWLLTFPSSEGAAGFVAAVLDSTLQPERMVVVSAGALRAAARPPAVAAVAVSVGSVAEAVESQGRDMARIGEAHGAEVAAVPEDVWAELGGALGGPVRLKLSGEPARLPKRLAEVERLCGEDSVPMAGIGETGSGVLWLSLGDAATRGSWLAGTVGRLREALAAEGGSVVVERAPREVKAQLDPWGPVPQDVLAIMTRIKHEFDPAGVLNAGRFVGGL
jgi:glycolate oxidase FAD binding subunit